MQYNEIGKTGMRVSNLSFGASSLGGVFHGIREDEAIEAVHTAVNGGINFIDVSPYYGHLKAETVLGKALKDIDRKKYFLSTKVGRYGKDGVNYWDYSAKRAKESVYESMERLNVDHIDLINVHDYPIDKLAIQYATSCNEHIATTLFSSANPKNVIKNINYEFISIECSPERATEAMEKWAEAAGKVFRILVKF